MEVSPLSQRHRYKVSASEDRTRFESQTALNLYCTKSSCGIIRVLPIIYMFEASLYESFLVLSFLFALFWENVAQLEPENSCATVLPSLMIPIFSTAPALVSQSSSMFLVSQQPGQNYFCDCLVNFVVPSNSSDCQLKLSFTGGYETEWTEPMEMVFWNVEPFAPSCCWIDAPDTTDIFGFVTLEANVTQAVVRSFACRNPISFRVGMSRAGAAGDCTFEQTQSDGLMLTYGC